MIRMRRLFTVVAAGLLAGAPALAAQTEAPNPFGVAGAGQQQDARVRDGHPRWRRGERMERRGRRMERRGARMGRRGERFEGRGERLEHRRGRLRDRHHQRRERGGDGI